MVRVASIVVMAIQRVVAARCRPGQILGIPTVCQVYYEEVHAYLRPHPNTTLGYGSLVLPADVGMNLSGSNLSGLVYTLPSRVMALVNEVAKG